MQSFVHLAGIFFRGDREECSREGACCVETVLLGHTVCGVNIWIVQDPVVAGVEPQCVDIDVGSHVEAQSTHGRYRR